MTALCGLAGRRHGRHRRQHEPVHEQPLRAQLPGGARAPIRTCCGACRTARRCCTGWSSTATRPGSDTPTDGWAAGKTIALSERHGRPGLRGRHARPRPARRRSTCPPERDNNNNGVSRLSILRFDTSAPGHRADRDARVERHRRSAGGGPEPGPRGDHLDPRHVPGRQRLHRRDHDGRLRSDAATRTTAPGCSSSASRRTATSTATRSTTSAGGFSASRRCRAASRASWTSAFDRDVGQLWAYCDNTCAQQGDAARASAAGHFQIAALLRPPGGLPDSNNEGITFAPESAVRGRPQGVLLGRRQQRQRARAPTRRGQLRQLL